MRKVTILNGKSAVFVRGFVEHLMEPGADAKLRKAQEAGQSAVLELGEDISVQYISKMSKLLQEEGIVTKTREGRHFHLSPGRNLHPFVQFLENNAAWGTSTKRELTETQITARSEFLDEMKNVGLVRIEANDPLDKAAYQVAQEKFKSGDYDMVFIRADLRISEVDSNDL